MNSVCELFNIFTDKNKKCEAVRGKVVLVTGASSGIGKQLAMDLYKYGAKVILASRSTDQLTKIRDEMIAMDQLPTTSQFFEPKILTLDLEKIETIKSKAEEAISMFGHLDILINNAGLSVRGGCLETDVSVYTRLMTVNFLGVVELTRHTCPGMLTRGSGHVVVISSVQGLLPTPYRGPYTASKHAVQAWADSLRAELVNTGITVTTVSPGYVNTNLSRNALTSSGGQHGQLDSTTEAGYSVEYVSEKVISCLVSSDRQLVLAPLYVKIGIIIRTVWPALYRYIMNRRAIKERKNI